MKNINSKNNISEKSISDNQKLFKKKLLDLLKDPKPKVVAIKGEWGSGKSTFWKDFVKNEHDNNAYISLYGLHSVRDIENSILLQISNRKFFSELIKKHFEPLSELKISGINAKSILSIIEPKDFKKIVICLDDFERLSNKISVNELFGFIADLKENKQCRVVMILNEEKISLKNKDDFDIQKEKVIDCELFFRTSLSDIKSIIKNIHPIYEEYLSKFIEKFEVQNLRTINKMIYLLNDFITKLQDELPHNTLIMKNILEKIIEISFIYYQFNFKDFELLKQYKNKESKSIWNEVFKKSNEQKNIEIGKTKKFLDENKELKVYDNYLKYFTLDDLEKNIISFVTKDEFDKSFFIDFIINEKDNLNNDDLKKQIDNIIDKYKYDFSYSLNNYDDDLYKFLSRHKGNILKFKNFETIKKEIEQCKKNSTNNYDNLLIDMQKAYLKDYPYINYHDKIQHHKNYQQIKKENNQEVLRYLESLIDYNKTPMAKDIIAIFEKVINTQKVIPISEKNTVNKLTKNKIKEFILNDKEFVEILFDNYDRHSNFSEFKQKLSNVFEDLKTDEEYRFKIDNLYMLTIY